MKVLQVANSFSPEYGGPVTVIEQLVSELKINDVEIEIAVPKKEGNPISIENVKVSVFKSHIFSKFWPGYSPALRKHLTKVIESYDIVHVHELWTYPNYIASKLAKKFNKPLVITIHGELDPWAIGQKALKKNIYMKLIQKRILENTTIIHTITEEGKQQVINQEIKGKIKTISNGIAVDKYKDLPDKKEFEKIYPILAGKQVLLFMGRIHPKKGLDLLAKSFGELSLHYPDLYLVIAGPDEDNYSETVNNLLIKYGVIDKTIFTGMLSGKEKMAALAKADVFTLPSYSEGFSMAILEALSCKIPVVVSDKCYFPEISKSKAGFIVSTSSIELTEALTNIFSTAEENKKLGANGFKLVSENYDWKIIAKKMKDLYEEALISHRQGT